MDLLGSSTGSKYRGNAAIHTSPPLLTAKKKKKKSTRTYEKADARTRARWVSQSGKGANSWAFVTPSKDTQYGTRKCPVESCPWETGSQGNQWQAFYHHVARRHGEEVSEAWWAGERRFRCSGCYRHYSIRKQEYHKKHCKFHSQSSQCPNIHLADAKDSTVSSSNITTNHELIQSPTHLEQEHAQPNERTARDTPTVEDLPTLSSICALPINTCKNIPNTCKAEWAKALTECMATAVYDNTIEAWTLLAMLPKCVIPAPRRGGDKGKASYSSFVRKCLTRWKNKEYQSLWNEASASIKRRHKSTPQIQSIEEEDRKAALRAVRLVRDGELSRAMTALTSEPLAPNDDTTFHKLQAKHPSRLLDPSPIATLPSDIKPLTATPEDITTALSSFHRGSSGGALGLRPEHLQVAVQYHHDARSDPLGTLTKLTSHMLAGKMPHEVQHCFAGGRLCALHKGEGDVRPIAAGETLRRLASKVGCLSAKMKSRTLFKDQQYGVATPAGAERVIHICRRLVAHNIDDEDFVICKVDLRNAFNHVSRDSFIALTRLHFPELSPFVEWCYSADSHLTFGPRFVLSSEGVQQGDPLGPLLFSLVMREMATEIMAGAPDLRLNLWYLDDGVLTGKASEVRHAIDIIEVGGPKWGLNLNPSKCEIITHPTSSQQVSHFPDIPGLNINTEGNLSILGSPIGSNAYRHQFFIDGAISQAEESLEAIEKLEDPQVALSLIRQCTGFCQMVYSLRTTPTGELMDLCRRLDNAVQRALENFFCPLSDMARWQTQRDKRFGGLGLRSAEMHATSAYVASVAFASNKDRWDATEAEGFSSAAEDINRRVGGYLVDTSTGKIPKESVVKSCPFSPSVDMDLSQELAVPRQRDLSHAISARDFDNSYASADPRTRARWISQSGEGASNWAFTIPSALCGHAYTATEFRTLIRWWLGENIYPQGRNCPAPNCRLPLGPEGDHALACKCGHGIITRHNTLAEQFSAECTKAGLSPQREVSLGNRGPGGALTRPADVFLRNGGVGQALVLDFAVTHVQQQKYTDLVRDANMVAAGSFAERYAVEHKRRQREEA